MFPHMCLLLSSFFVSHHSLAPELRNDRDKYVVVRLYEFRSLNNVVAHIATCHTLHISITLLGPCLFAAMRRYGC